MPANPAMTEYYARRASEHDRVYQKPERQADLARLHDLVASRLAGRAVYEAACGTGYWTAVYAPRATRVFAFDYNREVLDIARARVAAQPHVAFAQGDAFSPPVPPFACDGAFAGFWWSHLRACETSAFLDAWFARLAPGARFLLVDNRYVEGSSTPISRTDADGNTYQRRPLADGSTHEVLKNFPDESRLRSQLGARATDLRWIELDYFWVAEGTVV